MDSDALEEENATLVRERTALEKHYEELRAELAFTKAALAAAQDGKEEAGLVSRLPLSALEAWKTVLLALKLTVLELAELDASLGWYEGSYNVYDGAALRKRLGLGAEEYGAETLPSAAHDARAAVLGKGLP